MKLNFTKMTGAGNDFIVIENPDFIPEPKLIQFLCDRHFGVGADGILLIQKSEKANFGFRYFNSDGSGDSLCVNGARCAVWYGYLNNLCSNSCEFEFIQKIFRAEILSDELIKLFLDYEPKVKENLIIKFYGREIRVDYVDIGSRHIVIDWENFRNVYSNFLNDQSFDEFDVNNFGCELRNNSEFQPEGVNVNFIQKISDSKFKIRTYERGVEAETLACGSGSISSAIILFLKTKISPPIKLITRSSKILEVDFKLGEGKIEGISLIGPAEKVFDGTIEL
jgi:diaminopimelate epimerase